MQKLTLLLLGGICLSWVACGETSTTESTDLATSTEISKSTSSEEKTPPPMEAKQVSTEKINFTLSDWQAGEFKIKGKVPATGESPYEIRKESKMVSAEGESFEETTYVAALNGEDHMVLTPHFDIKTGTFTEKIDIIEVLSDQYSTPLGIGIGSTIEEFKATYPGVKCYYTYVSGMYWLETGSESTQFLLDGQDFQGKVTNSGDSEELKLASFKKGARIVKVRMY